MRLSLHQSQKQTSAWFRDNIVWIDICSKVIPGSPAKALDQARSAENKKLRLMSPGSVDSSRNAGGSTTADKQCSHGDTRVYFSTVPTRGIYGIQVFVDVKSFPGETPEGARQLVYGLPSLLDKMLGKDKPKPRTIFSDRGPGFFHRRWGTITGDYETALRENGFRCWTGSNSMRGPRAQPRDIADVLLHETANGWLNTLEAKCRPAIPWEETPEDLARRLQGCVDHINANYDVRGLCLEFPGRLETLVNVTLGDRLSK